MYGVEPICEMVQVAPSTYYSHRIQQIDPSAASECSSQHPPLKLLRRPLDFAQYLSIRYTERLGEAGIEVSVGSRGDSYDNALAESVIGLFKTEVIRARGPWRTIEDVEFAVLEWLAWFNKHRLLKPIGYLPPVEFEAAYHQQVETARLKEFTL